MNNNTQNNPEKKRGCLYGCLTAIGIIIVLLILVGSCSSYMNNRTEEDESDNSAETVMTDESEYQNEGNTDKLTETSMLEISQYFSELSDYGFNSGNKDKETTLAELNDLKTRVNQTLDNIKTIPLSKLQQYLLKIAIYQNNMCDELINYEDTGDEVYLNSALELMTEANQQVHEMNDYLSNENS